jgi:hypothetical protein
MDPDPPLCVCPLSSFFTLPLSNSIIESYTCGPMAGIGCGYEWTVMIEF